MESIKRSINQHNSIQHTQIPTYLLPRGHPHGLVRVAGYFGKDARAGDGHGTIVVRVGLPRRPVSLFCVMLVLG